VEDAVNKEVSSEEPVVKKAYTSPRLLEYGSISKLTQGVSGSVADGVTLMANPCL
jgi:hypothetical protein